MRLDHGLGHLTYSTLVHPGDTWSEMWQSLTTYAPAVKKRVSPDAPFGVSLRLSGASARRWRATRLSAPASSDFLEAEDLYVYTVNAFPQGPSRGNG